MADQPGPKPTTRAAAETHEVNLTRYPATPPTNVPTILGIDDNYVADTQGITITGFTLGSIAQAAGLQFGDTILEVDGAPVGLIRDRYYHPAQYQGRSGPGKTEVLVSFVTPDGVQCYYPLLTPTPIVTVADYIWQPAPPSFFTVAKPTTRAQPETEAQNSQRYVYVDGDFAKFARFQLGIDDLNYSYDDGLMFNTITPGTPASDPTYGLQVGDSILEVAGAPLGQFGNRLYEIWKQYFYSITGKVEFLVTFQDDQGVQRYYYPVIPLQPLSIQE